jgi:hypothetical protein
MSISSFFGHIETWFHNPKVEAAFNTVASIIQSAGVQTIVQEIGALTPNRTVQEITAAYAKYGVPTATLMSADPASTGAALLNLATVLVQKNLKNPAAVNLIQTAIQVCVTATKAAGTTVLPVVPKAA